jgi:signal transduction histidine kinase
MHVSLKTHTDPQRPSGKGAKSKRSSRPASAVPPSEARRNEELLRAAAAVLPKTGEEFLPAVVEQVALALGAELVMVGEYSGTDRVRTVSMWHAGRIVDNMEYPLRGTPCEQVAGRTLICYPRNVQQLFPQDEYLKVIGVEGYIGVPLRAANEQPIGIMAALTRDPIADEAYFASVLQLFAGRAAAEMERAMAERDLRSSQEHLFQVQRVEAIGRLTGNIAHDFNNLLMIVIGYAEMLRSQHGPSHELMQLLAAADRASTLTKQLLAFGRRQAMEVQRLDMNRVVTHVQSMVARLIGPQVRLTTTLDPRLPSVEADPHQIEQVLINLAINARDAMPEGGTLHIGTSVEQVAEAYNQMPPGRYVTVEVTDTGTGMTPEVLAHIFEPFFTTKGTDGTGLGLSSVYGIIKQTGGYIWCDSTPGQGTAFRIYLRPAPGAIEGARPPVEETHARPGGGTETILVVDDERGVRNLLTQILRGRGYRVIPTGDAQGALEVLTSGEHVDLVVTDIVMPGMSGTRLAEEIFAHRPEVKLIFVSGYSQGVALAPDSAARKVPLLGKPFTPARLEAMVRDVLDGAELRRPPVQPA